MTDIRATDVQWPVVTLDIEASGMSRLGYPIEIGFARWRGLDDPIESWATLIRPDIDWHRDGYWSKDAEAVHGITRDELSAGLVPEAVCARLNVELAGCTVCCDGFSHDQPWLYRLYEAGAAKPSFHLESMMRLHRWGQPGLARWLRENRHVPHRAREDALRLMRAFAYGMKRRPRRVVLP